MQLKRSHQRAMTMVALVAAVYVGGVLALDKPDVEDFPDEYFAPVMRIWRGGLHPVYFPMMSFYAPAMLLAYFCEEGIMATAVFTVMFFVLLLFIYEFAFLGHHGSYSRMWQYSMPNPDSILSNRGAVGGFDFIVCYLGTAFFGGVVGNVLSWSGIDRDPVILPSQKGRFYHPRQRTHNMVSLIAIFRRGCGGFLCPTTVNDEDNMKDTSAPATVRQILMWQDRQDDNKTKSLDKEREEAEKDQTTFANACTATSRGDRVTFGVFWDLLAIVIIIGFMTGPIRDALRKVNINYDWFHLLFLLAAFVIIWFWYQPYSYGEKINLPAWKGGPTDASGQDLETYQQANLDIYLRCYDKFHVLYPIFFFILIAQVGFCIFSSVMSGLHSYERAQLAQDATEARYIVQQNLMIEFVTVIIIFGIQVIFATLAYCLLIKGAIKRPASAT